MKSLLAPVGCVLFIEILGLGCAVDLDERTVLCAKGSIVESAHVWGRTIALRPSPGHEWQQVLREGVQGYASQHPNLQALRAQFGEPTREWSVEGRPFAEFIVPGGRLQLGLEEERSGNLSHRRWRLRLTPAKDHLAQVIHESAYRCIVDLLDARSDLIVLSRSTGLPGVTIKLNNSQVQQLVWTYPVRSSTSG